MLNRWKVACVIVIIALRTSPVPFRAESIPENMGFRIDSELVLYSKESILFTNFLKTVILNRFRIVGNRNRLSPTPVAAVGLNRQMTLGLRRAVFRPPSWALFSALPARSEIGQFCVTAACCASFRLKWGRCNNSVDFRHTGRLDRMSHRKWRETKQQLIWWPDLAAA